MKATFRMVPTALAVSLVAIACGGSTSSVPGDGGSGTSSGATSSGSSSGSASTSSSGSASSSGGGQDAGGPGCPSTQLADGSACSASGLVCEWGTSNVPDCDTVATCTAGAWNYAGHNPGGLDCGGGPPIACPASYATVPLNQPCSPPGGYCDYGEGRCACGTPAGPVELIDGSPASAIWLCQNPQSGCPQPRPLLGSPCSTEGQECDYGSCGEVPGGNAEQCTGGVWVTAVVGCPV